MTIIKTGFVIVTNNEVRVSRSPYLRGLENEVVDDDLLFVGEAQFVFADESDGEGLAVHGFLSARPVNKLVLRLRGVRDRFRAGQGAAALHSAPQRRSPVPTVYQPAASLGSDVHV